MAYQAAAEVLQPRARSSHFPAAFVSPQGATILGFGLLAIGPMRADQLHSSFGQACIECITVVGSMSDQRLWLSIDNMLGEGSFNKGDFMRPSTRHVDGDRKASAVCHCHDLRILPRLVFPT
jgi:hypothetical protein